MVQAAVKNGAAQSTLRSARGPSIDTPPVGRAGLLPGEELDVEVLRIGVCNEGWQCLTDNDACSIEDQAFEASQPLSSAPRLDQAELAGDYSVFDVSAVPVEETDPFTGGP